MKILMFGWEFPPYKSGGLGTACYDLCKGLNTKGAKITFIMPYAPQDAKSFVKIISSSGIKVRKVNSMLTAYATQESYNQKTIASNQNNPKSTTKKNVYGNDIYEEVERYSQASGAIARQEKHDVIHVHDWMTYKAGILAKKISGKPLIAHIHATEFDRTAGNPNPWIAHKEYEGMKAADIVIANSEFTKQNVMKHYKIPSEKIKVVHWGINQENTRKPGKQKNNKNVLFLGRITVQKGPDYFIKAAKKVLEFEPDTKFIMVGGGDMFERMINETINQGIHENFIFTGPLQGEDVHNAFKMADVFVMPSVSEPFGLVALEGMMNGAPIIISKTSGASEVIKHCLKVDFWDTDEIANKIISVLNYPALKQELRENALAEVKKHDIYKPAEKIMKIYQEVAR